MSEDRAHRMGWLANDSMTTSHLKQVVQAVEQKSLTVAHQTSTLGGTNNQNGGQSGGGGSQGQDKKQA